MGVSGFEHGARSVKGLNDKNRTTNAARQTSNYFGPIEFLIRKILFQKTFLVPIWLYLVRKEKKRMVFFLKVWREL